MIKFIPYMHKISPHPNKRLTRHIYRPVLCEFQFHQHYQILNKADLMICFIQAIKANSSDHPLVS